MKLVSKKITKSSFLPNRRLLKKVDFKLQNSVLLITTVKLQFSKVGGFKKFTKSRFLTKSKAMLESNANKLEKQRKTFTKSRFFAKSTFPKLRFLWYGNLIAGALTRGKVKGRAPPPSGVPGVDAGRRNQLPHPGGVPGLARLEQVPQRVGRAHAQRVRGGAGKRLVLLVLLLLLVLVLVLLLLLLLLLMLGLFWSKGEGRKEENRTIVQRRKHSTSIVDVTIT